MAGPALEIEAPPREKRVGGLSTIATVRTNDRLGAVQNVLFQSDQCTFPQLDEHQCYTGAGTGNKNFDGVNLVNAIGGPTVLYGGVKCNISFDGDSDFEERARSVLENGWDRALESILGTWLSGGTSLAAGGSVVGAIAVVDQALDDQYVGRGVIVMSRADAVRAYGGAGLKEAGPDKVPHTINGTPVLASGRIAPGVVYGTGVLVVEHSTFDVRRVLRPQKNEEWALAESVFTMAADCGLRLKSATT